MISHPVTKICIVGGGFGGLYTALKLEQLPWSAEHKVEITLIDKSDRFIFLPLLYELVTGEMQTWEVAPSFAELLGSTSIRFVQGEVSKIDIERQEIRLTDRQTLDYDRLVIGVGGFTPTDGIGGVKDYAIPFRTVNDAHCLKEKLRLLELNDPEKIRVAIVGGGYSGVELACKISDRLGKTGRVRIIDRGTEILKQADEFNRKSAEESLQTRQIWIDYETEVTALTKDTISLAYRGEVDTIPVDLVLWTVGNEVSPLIKELNLTKNERGQLLTNSYLQVKDHPEVFAVGDGADCGLDLPATAQVAIQQADYCSWNLWANISDRPMMAFKYESLGEMMTLGIDNATMSGLGIKLNGPFAHLARRFVYLYRLPTLEHQVNVGLSWLTNPIASLMQPNNK